MAIDPSQNTDRQVYTLLVELGRKAGDGLPAKATGGALMCYASGLDEAEAVRETIAIRGKGGYPHPRGWHSNRPSEGPGGEGPRLPQSSPLRGLVEVVCREEEVGVAGHCNHAKQKSARELRALFKI